MGAPRRRPRRRSRRVSIARRPRGGGGLALAVLVLALVVAAIGFKDELLHLLRGETRPADTPVVQMDGDSPDRALVSEAPAVTPEPRAETDPAAGDSVAREPPQGELGRIPERTPEQRRRLAALAAHGFTEQDVRDLIAKVEALGPRLAALQRANLTKDDALPLRLMNVMLEVPKNLWELDRKLAREDWAEAVKAFKRIRGDVNEVHTYLDRAGVPRTPKD